MTAKLSETAESALLSAYNRQGAVPTSMTAEAHAELARLELIGVGDGLTRKGLIARERVFAARLDEAF